MVSFMKNNKYKIIKYYLSPFYINIFCVSHPHMQKNKTSYVPAFTGHMTFILLFFVITAIRQTTALTVCRRDCFGRNSAPAGHPDESWRDHTVNGHWGNNTHRCIHPLRPRGSPDGGQGFPVQGGRYDR